MRLRKPSAICSATLIAGWVAALVDALQATVQADRSISGVTVLLAMAVTCPLALVIGVVLRTGLWFAPIEPGPADLMRAAARGLAARGNLGRRYSAGLVVFVLFASGFFALSYRLNLWFMVSFHNTRLAAFVLAGSVGAMALGLVIAWPRTVRLVHAGLEALSRRLGSDLPMGRPWFWMGGSILGLALFLLILIRAYRQTIEAIRFGPVLVLGLIALGGYLAGYALGLLRHRTRLLVASAVMVVSVGVTTYTVLATGSSDASLDSSYVLEEYSWFSRLPLARLQSLLDRDGDGFSAALGGGDCEDGRADIYPGATETPANGIDEDCSGSDLVLDVGALAVPPPFAEPPDREAEVSPPLDNPIISLQRPWNVILLTVDAVRPDHLGYAGYPRRDISPNIDRLARMSSHFLLAYSCSNKTPTAMPPILASRWPSEMDRTFHHFSRYRDSNLFFAEVLQEAGYLTAASVSHWYFRREYGFAQGFQDWREYWVSGDRMERVPTSEQTADHAIAFLEEYYDQDDHGEPDRPPYFLWIHFMDPHKLYLDHEGFEPYGSEPVDQYDGEIRFADHHIGRILEVLERYQALSDTVIIFSSDHGEAFGEHGMRHHGWDLYEHQIRVPLFFYLPGQPYREFRTRVSLMDLGPTILDLVGVSIPASFRGRSLLRSFLTGQEPPMVPIFAEMPLGPHNRLIRGFILGDLKLIHHVRSRRFRMFNLAEDPGELTDLWEVEPEQADRLRQEYERFMATQIAPIPARGEPTEP